VSAGLIAHVRWARRKQLKRDIEDANFARQLLRTVAKDRDNSGDRRGHDLTITAMVAVEDVIDHLEARL
jgi:hypothetical protein